MKKKKKDIALNGFLIVETIVKKYKRIREEIMNHFTKNK